MTAEEQKLIGNLQAGLLDLREDMRTHETEQRDDMLRLFDRIDGLAAKVDFTRGVLQDTLHAPGNCPLSADVKCLLAYKNKALGIIAVISSAWGLCVALAIRVASYLWEK